jgi:hypothetical protein
MVCVPVEWYVFLWNGMCSSVRGLFVLFCMVFFGLFLFIWGSTYVPLWWAVVLSSRGDVCTYAYDPMGATGIFLHSSVCLSLVVRILVCS